MEVCQSRLRIPLLVSVISIMCAYRFSVMLGMWGGVKGVIYNMSSLITSWKSGHTAYMEDMRFLWATIFPIAKHSVYQSDSYCCEIFRGTHPFPYPRLPNLEHVGQVFLEDDTPRFTDIDNFLRGHEAPMACRKNSSDRYG
jgi:hypothetical protein